MAGSLLLPALLVIHPRRPYVAIALLAAAMRVWCMVLSRDTALAAEASTAPIGRGFTQRRTADSPVPQWVLRLIAPGAKPQSPTQMVWPQSGR
jgi:hypothetical protein